MYLNQKRYCNESVHEIIVKVKKRILKCISKCVKSINRKNKLFIILTKNYLFRTYFIVNKQ